MLTTAAVRAFALAMMFIVITGEQVHLESLDNSAHRLSRSLDQPKTLKFRLRRSAGEHHDVILNLTETTTLNPNAPIYIHGEDGSVINVPIDITIFEDTKYFQDRTNGAYVTSSCNPPLCYTILTGNLVIEGKEYKLEPLADYIDSDHAHLGVPHSLEPLEQPNAVIHDESDNVNIEDTIDHEDTHDHKHEDTHDHKHEDTHDHKHEDTHDHKHEDTHDHKHEDTHGHGHEDTHDHKHEDTHGHKHEDTHDHKHEPLEQSNVVIHEELDNVNIDGDFLDYEEWLYNITEEEVDKERHKQETLNSERQKRHSSQTNTITAHGIEMLLAVDHLVYDKFATLHAGLSEKEILLKIRRYLSHIVNGVDLRYGSIQEDDISFYVTISGFIISKKLADSPFLNYGGKTTDALKGLSQMIKWRRHRTDKIPKHDHLALVTGFNIQYRGNEKVVGMAFNNGVCKYYCVSVVEDRGFFRGAWVMAHELGHNLGAAHDDHGDCWPSDEYIMTPYVYNLQKNSTTINPWRFSPCSVNSFRTYVNRLGAGSCTLNRATIYDKGEYKNHTRSLTGQLFNVSKQCELLKGNDATFCSNNENTPDVCRNLGCATPQNTTLCHSHVAAHGTPCGEGNMCFEGHCRPAHVTTPAPITTAVPSDVDLSASVTTTTTTATTPTDG